MKPNNFSTINSIHVQCSDFNLIVTFTWWYLESWMVTLLRYFSSGNITGAVMTKVLPLYQMVSQSSTSTWQETSSLDSMSRGTRSRGSAASTYKWRKACKWYLKKIRQIVKIVSKDIFQTLKTSMTILYYKADFSRIEGFFSNRGKNVGIIILTFQSDSTKLTCYRESELETLGKRRRPLRQRHEVRWTNWIGPRREREVPWPCAEPCENRTWRWEISDPLLIPKTGSTGPLRDLRFRPWRFRVRERECRESVRRSLGRPIRRLTSLRWREDSMSFDVEPEEENVDYNFQAQKYLSNDHFLTTATILSTIFRE